MTGTEARLKDAIDRNDLAEVAECRVPRVPPDATRPAMAQWMIGNGSDLNAAWHGRAEWARVA